MAGEDEEEEETMGPRRHAAEEVSSEAATPAIASATASGQEGEEEYPGDFDDEVDEYGDDAFELDPPVRGQIGSDAEGEGEEALDPVPDFDVADDEGEEVEGGGWAEEVDQVPSDLDEEE